MRERVTPNGPSLGIRVDEEDVGMIFSSISDVDPSAQQLAARGFSNVAVVDRLTGVGNQNIEQFRATGQTASVMSFVCRLYLVGSNSAYLLRPRPVSKHLRLVKESNSRILPGSPNSSNAIRELPVWRCLIPASGT